MTDKPFYYVDMLGAHHGDCFWVEYGRGAKTSRFLIDGGPIGAFESLDARIQKLTPKQRALELVVMSHVDTDHVDGLVRLFGEKPLRCTVNDVWFNGWDHLDTGRLGGAQGEFFSALVMHRLGSKKWNNAFGGEAIVVEDDGDLPVKKLKGGMKLTIISPTRARLKALRSAWKTAVNKRKFTPGDLDKALKVLASDKKYLPDGGLVLGDDALARLVRAQAKPDNAAANGSSIAFLAEYAGKSCLFLADAHTKVVISGLKRLLEERGEDRLKVDAVKISHHGSKGNTSAELISLVDAKYFLISSNGDQFEHPNREPIALIIDGAKRKPTICFNYRTKFNRYWFDETRQEKLGYTAKDMSTKARVSL